MTWSLVFGLGLGCFLCFVSVRVFCFCLCVFVIDSADNDTTMNFESILFKMRRLVSYIQTVCQDDYRNDTLREKSTIPTP